MHTLYNVGKVCEQSAACNGSQLAGSHDGTVYVQCYNWQEFLPTFFPKVENITEYNHFVFSKDAPGIVKCSVKLENVPAKITLQKKNAQLFKANSLKWFPQVDSALKENCIFLKTSANFAKRVLKTW